MTKGVDYTKAMKEGFLDMLTVGGKSNSLGRAEEVTRQVLQDKSRLGELYDCMFAEDAWVRMRAADALEKVCRSRPEWLLPYIDRLQKYLGKATQPSLLWHLAQIYRQVPLTVKQKDTAIKHLKRL